MVCGYDDYEEENKIIYCDICDLGVHQNCVGIINKDVTYLDFVCFSCQAFKTRENSMSLKCQICFNTGGAMMPSNLSLKKWKYLESEKIQSHKFVNTFFR